jgi:SOS response regulatory protein OraA/RecX
MNQRIYNYSIHLLARQDYSEYKLKQKLRSKKDNLPHEVDEVLAKLKEKGLLREEAYRRLFIRKWMIKGEAEDKIRQRGAMEKLVFEEGEFEKVAVELGFNDDESLEKLVQKKLRGKTIPTDRLEKQKLRDKVFRFLLSKGHSFSEIKPVLEKALKGVTDFDEESV